MSRIPTPRSDALADRFGNIDPENDPYWQALDLATELEKELHSRSEATQEYQSIGEVIGHRNPGQALVEWYDCGLRPIGLKLYSRATSNRS